MNDPFDPSAMRKVLTSGGPRHRRACLVAFALFLGVAIGAGPPEIVRARVPAARVPSLFPAGAELRVLPYDDFEELVRKASLRPELALPPHIARASHHARWEEGMLIGRSVFAIGPGPGGAAGLVVLDPWSPAVTGAEAGTDPRATADGRLALRVGPDATGPATIDWRLRARSGSDGRVFSFDLPDLAIAALTLDLPPGLIPEAVSGDRVGPSAGPAPGRSAWTFEGVRGRVNLRLRDRDDAGAGVCWVEGKVRIDLAASAANWRGEWTVVTPTGARGQLTIDLDPGLELIDVAGPRVSGFHAEPSGTSTRVVVALAEEGPTTSPVSLIAIARAPAEGSWLVPSARFPGSAWIGDRTTIRPDSSREIEGCTERHARKVAPRPDEAGSIAFEATSPGPVAELVFRRSTPVAVADVQGRLRLGDGVPRLTATTTWLFGPGKAPDLAVSLPPGWAADRAFGSDGGAVEWHGQPAPDGGTSVRFAPSAAGRDDRPLALTIVASAVGMGTTGPIDLPRVQPVSAGVRVAEEVWGVSLEPGLTLNPTAVAGLAWLDASEPGSPETRSSLREGDELRDSLRWRWVGDAGAKARVDRIWDRPTARADVRTVATVRAGRLRLDWTLVVDATDEPVRSIPIRCGPGIEAPPAWKAFDPAGPRIETKAIAPAGRADAGFPAEGPAWDLVPSRPLRGRFEFHSHIEIPWEGRSEIPLVFVAPRFRPRGLVAVDVEPTTRVRVDSEGFTAIDPATTRPGTPDPPSAGLRRASLLVRRQPDARIRLVVEPGTSGTVGGLVREATLTTENRPGATARHRLRLRVATDAARSIVFAMPPGASLDRVRRDGQAVAVSPAGRSIAIPLPPPTATRPTCTLMLDYRTDPDNQSHDLDPVAVLPGCSFPCLSFAWELNLPAPWAIGEVGPGLTDLAPRPDPSWSARWLGVEPRTGRPAEIAGTTEAGAAMLHDLEATAGTIAPGETTLGDLLVRLDAGRWPVVVDRLAVESAGFGPRSRLDFEPKTKPVVPLLASIGLVAMPADGKILVTTRVEAPVPILARDAVSLRLAATTGADEADRFQAASRWWGETTPRALAVGESLESVTASSGWTAHRFVSAQWPSPRRCRVVIFDARRNEWLGWSIAAAVWSLGIFARRLTARGRAVVLASIGLMATGAIGSAWPGTSPVASGLARGGLALLAWWVGLGIRPPAFSETSDQRGWRIGRRHPRSTRAAVLFVILVMTATSWAADLGADAPIRVVLPYDGSPDPQARPDRVALLLADYDRLARLARREAVTPSPTATIAAAKHRLGREPGGRVLVESVYEVGLDGDGEATWTLPVGPGRDLEADLDGRSIPLAIAPDGASATVPIVGRGMHTLRFARWVTASAIGTDGEMVRVPINRAAFARVAVARGDRARWVDIPDAAGSLAVVGEGIEGALGPVATLDVRWFPDPRPSVPSFVKPIETATLWEIRLAGDLARVRITHDEEDDVAAIRLALGPGVMLREGSVPNLVAARREGTAERPRVGRPRRPALAPGCPDQFHRLETSLQGRARTPSPRGQSGRCWGGRGDRRGSQAGRMVGSFERGRRPRILARRGCRGLVGADFGRRARLGRRGPVCPASDVARGRHDAPDRVAGRDELGSGHTPAGPARCRDRGDA